ncbi:MAG: RidA family protein [Sciscionella sp.]
MNVEHINPVELGAPSGFSHAVRVSGGTTVYLAGQTALNAEGVIVGCTVVEQFENALASMLTALRAAGGSPEDLVSLTIYLLDIEDYKAHASEIGAVWRMLIGTSYPAVAGVGVARLWNAEALVEVQGIACVPSDDIRSQ